MEIPCWLCDIRPIESKRKPLCHSCYTVCNEVGLLHIFPSISRNESRVLSAIKKYGYELKIDMESLNRGETTLSAVGDKHGISRERVRQLFPIFNGLQYGDIVSMRKVAKKVACAEKKNKRKIEMKTIESRLLRYAKNTKPYIGLVAENLFLKKCTSLGFDVEMTLGTVDSIVNGYFVDVKSSVMSTKCQGATRQRFYHFRTREKQHKITDFFAVLLFDIGVWYIIPKSEVKLSVNGSATFNIPKYDIEYNGMHRYKDLQKYREAWHLLRRG